MNLKDLAKGIGNAIVKSDDDAQNVSTGSTKSQLPPGVKQPVVPRTTGVVPRSTLTRKVSVPKAATDFDQEYFTKILEEIGRRVPSPEGFDQLIQLTISMGKTMASVSLADRFNMALETVGPTTGLDKATVIKTLQAQLAAMEDLQVVFTKDTQSDADDQKAAHSKATKELGGQVKQLEQDLADLQQQLTQTRDKLSTEEKAIGLVDSQLEADRQAFTGACDAVKQGASSMNWFGIAALLDMLGGGQTSEGKP